MQYFEDNNLHLEFSFKKLILKDLNLLLYFPRYMLNQKD